MLTVPAHADGMDWLKEEYQSRGLPYQVHIDLLFACDLDCSHCYLSERKSMGLSTTRVRALLDELAEAGVMHLLISGGEIFLRKDILELLAHAQRRRFVTKLISHAGRIDAARANALAELCVDEVGVSLYSMVAEDHEAITRVPGSHARTVAGIQHLRRAGVPVQLKCSVMEENLASWWTVEAFAAEEGCQFDRPSFMIVARDDLDYSHVHERNLSFAQRVALQKGRIEDGIANGRPWKRADPAALDAPLCKAGHRSCYVHPSGKVYPCTIFYQEVGDLETESFQQIWESSPGLKAVRGVTRRSFSECQSCEFLADCGPCMAGSLQATGGITNRSPLICTQTHARFAAAYELGLYPHPVEPPPDAVGLERPPCATDPSDVAGSGCAC